MKSRQFSVRILTTELYVALKKFGTAMSTSQQPERMTPPFRTSKKTAWLKMTPRTVAVYPGWPVATLF